MTREERIRLSGLFIRKSLAMQGFADAVSAAGTYGSYGERLNWCVRQLRFRSRDVGAYKLEPYDLVALLASVRDTVDTLRKHNLPDLYVTPLIAHCTQLSDELETAGVAPR